MVTGMGKVDVAEMRSSGIQLEGAIEAVVKQGKITAFSLMAGEPSA